MTDDAMDNVECEAFVDPAPAIQVGDFVQARGAIDDEDISVAVKGDVGTVIAKTFDPVLGWSLPTVQFERTGAIYDVFPEEIHVLAPPDFATRAETTPKKAVRVFLNRGAQ